MTNNKHNYAPCTKDLSNLEVKLFLCGGQGKGESMQILFIDKESHSALISILIDSFGGMYCYLKDKQKEYNIDHLTCICWTHPHEDHTNDLDKIIGDASSNTGLVNYKVYDKHNIYDTTILYPKIFSDEVVYRKRKRRLIKLDKKRNKLINKIIASKSSHKISVGEYYQKNFSWVIKEMSAGKEFNISLHILTPHCNTYEKAKRDKDRKTVEENYNVASLSGVLSINERYFIYLGGDLENSEIQDLTTEDIKSIKRCSIIKLPHHGSKHSSELLKYTNDQLDYVLSTVDKTQNDLPSPEVIEQYNKKIKNIPNRVLVTNESIADNNNIGIIEITLSFNDKGEVIKKHKTYGLTYNE